MSATTVTIDEQLNATLELLKGHYKVNSNEEILRKALALLNVARNCEQPDGSVIIKCGEHLHDEVRIILL